MRHLLLLDIGNSNIKIGVLREEEILGTYSLPTRLDSTADAWGLRVVQILGLHGLYPGDVSGWVACSVVPPMSELVRAAGERFCSCPVLFVPEDMPVPLENLYARPHEVGADRLVAASAARTLFSSRSLIVVDFGTATTFDCIQDTAYLGGLICPGLYSSAAALASKTAKLPTIGLDGLQGGPRIGQSTAESLRNGMVFGFASMVEGLCARLKDCLQPPVEVVVTGGPAKTLVDVCTGIDHYQPDLLMRGLVKTSLENAHLLRKGVLV
ncbi:type III pantothenate kinase [Desulfonatronum thioautotrophicum]|uniref:type III pantothenate kinase n=1 Tax=Desulfonatronum thioautotrophicum TaxID=617001 RepID=UPI0005EBDE04|nr:type III pantothenate kinase [Desulfonatronum thioautotrophicum]